MGRVAGIDSSTQSCKVVIRDAETGRLVRQGRRPHPDGTEIHPRRWWEALQGAVDDAGGLGDVDAISVAAQQHGCVCLDEDGEVVRPALLWNDTRSAQAAADLIAGLGGQGTGPQAWVDAVGSVPVASFTVSKLRWIAEHEPDLAARTSAVCLPHDWLTWQLREAGHDLGTLTTDRSDASGTGYWAAATGSYRHELLELAFGRSVEVPRVLDADEPAGQTPDGKWLGPGAGDNAGAALGLSAAVGDVVVSIGTSGTVFGVSPVTAADPTGIVAGFADATGHFLPLVCTLNAARVLDAAARLLRVDHGELSRLALSAPAGADGLVVVPYLEGERTPDLPHATGAVHGLRLETSTPEHLARATIEGLLCGLADGLDALVEQGMTVRRILLIGGGAASEAVQTLAPAILGHPVAVPEPGEYVADGAARQAAWILAGGQDPPAWEQIGTRRAEADPSPFIRDRYADARAHILDRPA